MHASSLKYNRYSASLLSQRAPIKYGSDTKEGTDPVDEVYFYMKKIPWEAFHGSSEKVIHHTTLYCKHAEYKIL